MKLELVRSMSFETEHALMHRVVGTDVYRETVTPVNKRSGQFGEPKVCWYHAADKMTHDTYEQAAAFKKESAE